MSGTYNSIASVTVSGTPSNITFSNISTAWTDLILIWHLTFSAEATIVMRFNSDTSSIYSNTLIAGSGSSLTSSRQSNVSSMGITYQQVTPGVSGSYAMGRINIMSYANTNVFKTVLSTTTRADSSVYGGVETTVGLWRSTSAINSITIQPAGSQTITAGTASLYGIKAE